MVGAFRTKLGTPGFAIALIGASLASCVVIAYIVSAIDSSSSGAARALFTFLGIGGAFVGLVVGILLLARYHRVADRSNLLVAVAFLGDGLLECLRTYIVLSSAGGVAVLGSLAPSAWALTASRTFLPVALVLRCVAARLYSVEGKGKQWRYVLNPTEAVAFVWLLFCFVLPLLAGGSGAFPVPALAEVWAGLPAFMHIFVLGVCVIQRAWKDDLIELGIVFALALGSAGEVLFLTALDTPFSPAFNASMVTRLSGGLIMLASLSWSLHISRRREYEAIVDLGETNVRLKEAATESERVGKALRSTVDQLAAVLDTSSEAVLLIGEDGVIKQANRSAEEIFGYDSRDLIGKDVSVLMPEPYRSEHHGYIQRYLDTQESTVIGKTIEVNGLRSSGDVFPVDIRVSEIRIDGQRMFSGNISDATERKQVERLQDEFISTVSHEMRTPLTSIMGSLSLIVNILEKDAPPNVGKLLSIARDNSDHLLGLITGILDAEKIRSGAVDYRMSPLSIDELVMDATKLNSTFATNSKSRFVLTKAGEDVRVNADRQKLTQVLTNLLSNAVKFSPEGCNVDVAISTQEDDEKVRVSVRDQGPGIPEDFRDRIFSRFAQANLADARPTGTGMGLYISRLIIEKHEGTIGFETETGHGTTFFFELPKYRERPFTEFDTSAA